MTGLSAADRFYAGLPVITDFVAVGLQESYTPLPDDWHVALCDVRNSTAAVEAGRYKNVNSLGAAAITAVLNASEGIELPYSFEGDGCVLCVPPRMLPDTRAALALVREVARDSFGLDLRIATVPVAAIRAAGHAIRVARYRVSEHYIQAVFAGGGMAFADRLIKDPGTAAAYLIVDGSVEPRGSLEGFECRWQDIPSRHGETVSLMVRVIEKGADADPARAGAIYSDLIAKIREIYGDDETCHPVVTEGLAPAFDSTRLADEVGIRAARRSPFGKWIALMRTRWFVLLGMALMKFGIRTAGTDWGRYKETLVRNTDVRKFNDAYRQILSGNAAQREALEAWLEARHAAGDLVHGIHVSDRAQMTCMVFGYGGRHFHFIDGADGGLFLAARQFKERLIRSG